MLKTYIFQVLGTRGTKCDECNKCIDGGTSRIDVVSGSWQGRSILYTHYHPECFWLALYKEIKKPKGRYLKGFEMGLRLGKE